MATNKKINYSKLLIGLVILLFFIYLFLHFSQVSDIPKIISSLNPIIIIALLILEILFLVNRGSIYKFLYAKMQAFVNIIEMTELFCISYTLNIIAPSVGISGIAFYISQAERHKISKTKVVLINLLFYFANYISIAFLLILSCIYFLITKNTNYYVLNTIWIILTVLLLIFLLIYLAYKNNQFLQKIVNIATKFINFFLKILRINLITQKQSTTIIEEIHYFKIQFSKDKSLLWQPFWLFILGNIYEIITIYLIIVGLGGTIGIVPTIVSYSVGLLFMLLSITPSGIGVVEPVMALILTSFGVSWEIAGLTVLIFRAVTFWLPLPVGLVLTKKYFK